MLTIAIALSVWQPARADDYNYLNLSFTGDGSTPSATQLFEAQEAKIPSSRAAGSATDNGDVSYAIPVPLPPALLSPSVALSYDSAAGDHSVISRGWSLNTGTRIVRLTGQSAAQAYADVPNAFRVSGGGLDGLLFQPWGPSGAWQYVSTGGLAVHAEYDDTTLVWTIKAGGVTTWLAADPPTPEDSATSGWNWSDGYVPSTWHAYQMRDGSGNTVKYDWTGNRLDAIHYGGASTDSGGLLTEVSGEEAFLEVSFDYSAREHTSYQATHGGFVDRITDRLDRIVVSSSYDGAMETQLAVELDYDLMADQDVLTEVVKTDGVDPAGESLVVATFEYASLPCTDDECEDTYEGEYEAPTFTSESVNSSPQVGVPSSQDTLASLSDVTGDGLVDSLDTSFDAFRMSWGTDDEATWEDAAFDLDHPDELPAGDTGYDGDSLERSYSVRCDDADSPMPSVGSASMGWSLSIGLRRLVDINGDGFVDVVQSDEAVPATSYYPDGVHDTAPALCTSSWTDVTATWRVMLGGPNGFESEGETFTVPALYPRVGMMPVTKHADPLAVDENPGPYRIEDTQVDLLDINGDGWSDIVFADRTDRRIKAYFHGARYEDGWSSVALDLSALPGLEGIDSLEASDEVLDQKFYSPPGTAEWDYYTPQVDETRIVEALRDVNGDGLLDWVDTTSWTDESPTWQVWLGTGASDDIGGKGVAAAFEPPVSWPAPIGWLSRTKEGRPSALVCFASNPASNPPAPSEDDFVHLTDQEMPHGYTFQPLSELGHGPSLNCNLAGPGTTGGPHVDDPSVWGEPQREVTGLLDVDGDGRLDLVDLFNEEAHVWWRNVGDGFAIDSNAAPSWYGLGLHAAVTHELVYVDMSFDEGTTYPDPTDENSVKPSAATTVTTWVVMDINGDGVPDRVHSDDPYAYTDEASILYGQRPDTSIGTARAGLLTDIQTTYGAATAFAYRSTATVEPSGVLDGDQHMPSHHDVVEQVAVDDPVTGNGALDTYDFADGYCAEGQCEGFGSRTIQHSIHDADIHATDVYQAMSDTETTYDLGRDWALPTRIAVSVDLANAHVTATPVAPSMSTRFRYDRSYQEVTVPVPPRLGVDVTVGTRWLAGQAAREYAGSIETFPETLTWRDSTVFLDRDDHGNVTESRHRDGSCLDDETACTVSDADVLIDVSYAEDDDASHFLPATITTYGRDAAGDWQMVEEGTFGYDGNLYADPLTGPGLLTVQDVASGLAGDIEDDWLEWTWTRDDRGAITHWEAPGGRSGDSDWTYGDALRSSETNALSQEALHWYDAMGRSIRDMDVNGVVTSRQYDAFGRRTAEYLVPVQPPPPPPTVPPSPPPYVYEYRTASYDYEDAAPHPYVETHHYRYDTVSDLVASVTTTEYAVLDGFGGTVQTWKPTENPSEWLVTESVTDIDGEPLFTSYPHRVATLSFSADFDVATRAAAGAWTSLTLADGLGRPMETWTDYAADLGHTYYDYDESPGEVGTIDADLYAKQVVTDTRGRVTAVYDGVYGGTGSYATSQTATWSYDARDRVTGFVDGNDNEYDYLYDGAGRLREVDHAPYLEGVGIGTESAWYAYEYDGPNPTEMYEGDALTGTLVATWDYDALGRTIAKGVLNRTTSAMDDYTWAWDRPMTSGGWFGQRDYVEEPSGDRTTYTYDWETWGKLGRLTSVEHAWGSSTATFSYALDFDGHNVETDWPDGSVVTSTYTAAGWLSAQEAVNATAAIDVGISYTYDDFGLMESWSGNDAGLSDFTGTYVHDTPTRLNELQWSDPSGGLQVIDYAYSDGGLIAAKQVSLGTATTPPTTRALFDYSYDDLRRIAEVADASSTLETYTYDTIGNLTEMYRLGEGTWDYDGATFSTIPTRTNALTGDVDEQTWDAQGRLTQWDTLDTSSVVQQSRLYQYDGAGRLVEIETQDGLASTDTVYSYDVDDQMTREAHDSGEIDRFQGYRLDTSAGTVVEQLLPMVSLEGTNLRWTFKEADGHALSTYSSTGGELSFQLLGAYGKEITATGTSPWKIHGFQGHEADDENAVVQMGARHMLPRDGEWMQPEPLLRLAPVAGDLSEPLRYQGEFADANPVNAADANGRWTPVVAGAAMAHSAAVASECGSNCTPQKLLATEVDVDVRELKTAAAGTAVGVMLYSGAAEAGAAIDVASMYMGYGEIFGTVTGSGALLGGSTGVAAGTGVATAAEVEDEEGEGLASYVPGQRFFRGVKEGEAPDFTPRPGEFKVDKATGIVKDADAGGRGVSVFDNPGSVESKGYVPYEVDQGTVPDSLTIVQRGSDPKHYEIVPAPGANLTVQQYTTACQGVGCKQ